MSGFAVWTQGSFPPYRTLPKRMKWHSKYHDHTHWIDNIWNQLTQEFCTQIVSRILAFMSRIWLTIYGEFQPEFCSHCVSKYWGSWLQLLSFQNVRSCYLECHFIIFRKVLREGKESRVQTAKPHKLRSGEEIIMESLCVMPVAFITNYIV